MTSSDPAPRGPLHSSLWAVQILLAFSFLAAGGMKATQPLDALAAMGMTFVPRLPGELVRFIGACEVLGGIGLIAPAASRIAPRLTGLAAAGLALVMALAVVEHARNGEYPQIIVNVVLGGLSVFVAWGRLVKVPIAPRQ